MTSRPQPATVSRLGQSASGPSRHLAERERLHGESDGRRVLSTSLPRSAIPAEPSIRESRPVPPGPLKSISLSKAAPASNPLPAKPPSSSHYAASFGPSQKPAPSTSCSPPGPVYHERPQKHASTSDSHLSARSTANGTCQDYNQLYNKPWPKLEGNWMNVDNSELSISVIKHAPTSSSNGNRKRRYNGHGLSLPLSDPRKDPQRMQKVAARDLPPVKNVPQLEKITYTWDSHSVGDQPKRPTSALVVTRIDTIVSTVEVRAHFAKFGSIQDYDLKLDRSTGSHLGVAYVSYVDKTVWDEKAGKFTTQGMDQDGGLVASLAVQQTDGQKIGRSAAAGGEKGVVRCWLDRDGTKGIAEENAELKRRADRRRAERERAQRSQRPSSSGTSRASVNGPGESSTGQQLEASSSKHQRPSLSGDTVASSSSIDAIVAQASKQIIQDLRESMERRIRHNFVSQAVEDRLIKRIKLDKKAVVAPPPVPTGPRHSVSNSGQYVVPYFITAPAMLSMPPTLPTSPPKASTFSNLPGAVTLPATAHPPPMFNVSALQPSSSHVPNQHISKLPSFKPKANKLKDKTSPPLAKQQKLPSPAAIDTASSEPSESSRRRSSKSPSEPDKTASVRAHSPPSSLSSVHSGVAVSEDDDGTKDEDEESDSDSDASEDEDFPPLSRSPPRPNKELQRDPSNLGKLKAKRHPLSKASKVVDWTTSEAEDSDGDQSAQSEDKPLQSLGPQMSPKRQPTHVLNNGHGVKQIGSPVRVQPSHKSSTAEPLAPVTTKPRVILEEEFKVAPEKNLQSPASLPNSSQHTLLSPITPALETGVTELAPETPAFPTSPPKLQEHQQQLGEPFQLEAEPDTPGERDLYRLGLVADEEDFYYIRRVLERRRHGLGMRPDEFMKEPVFREEALDIPSHSTGSARTEGYYKLQAGAKAALLPQRNRAMVDTTLSASSVAISRSSRAESRRAAGGATTGNATSDSDIIKFNQLKSRGKLLKFSRSPIHDWGLYAMERIERGDFVIEYIGELIRQLMADKREMAYERSGIGSSYLFRIDDDFVVDATKKGSMSRLINHSCNPNCIAKIITISGVKKIVIYARQTIEPGDEITYDYKFAVEAAEFKIPCLCGAPNCRRYLN